MFSRPAPPRGNPPPYAFVNRVYRGSLRPAVLLFSSLSAIFLLLWGIASFRDISIDKQHAPKLQTFDIVLGTLYIASFVIEVLGIVAASVQKLPMIRIFTFLSLAAALIVIAAELIRVVLHFAFKNDLINECIALATGQTVVTRFGIWGPTSSQTLSQEDATDFCNNAWSHDSFEEIAWFIVALIASLFFASINFAYYRQMLDPSSAANAARAPSAQARAAVGGFGAQPQHYTPPYAAGGYGYGGGDSTANLGYPAPRYAPPPGPPPAFASMKGESEDDLSKPPRYGEGDARDLRREDVDQKDPFGDFDEPVKV